MDGQTCMFDGQKLAAGDGNIRENSILISSKIVKVISGD
jgi:hypothetical protein